MAAEELKYQIAFAALRGMGVELAQKFLDVLAGGEREFFELSEHELRKLTGGTTRMIEDGYRRQQLERAEREIEFIEKNHIAATYYTSPDYPRRLLEATDAPLMIYTLGKCDLNARHIISVVGTRHATEYGKHFCDTLVKDLSEKLADVVIVSGLAYGIDIAAHRAALRYNVPTVAVQACGLNKIYPSHHRRDAVAMAGGKGLILTDYLSSDEMHRGNFLARNRIIAGIADCTVVVESASHGGALVTARLAASYNRDVFAVPGRSGDEFSRGCNRLIRNNQAMLVTCADEIIDAMGWESRQSGTQTSLELFPKLNADEQRVVDVIREAGDIHINDLNMRLGLPVYKVMATLVELDCRGIVVSLPGARYTLA